MTGVVPKRGLSVLQCLWESPAEEEHQSTERKHVWRVRLQPQGIAEFRRGRKKHKKITRETPKQKKARMSETTTEMDGERKGKNALGRAIRALPVPARELELDTPQPPLGRDLAPLRLDGLQTPVERDARHAPLPSLPRRDEIARVRLELERARMHLRRGRAARLRSEHRA